MIPFDFVYCRAQTIEEAVREYARYAAMGLSALYYAGGSEIITMVRAGAIRPHAVIDVKDIPECRGIVQDEDGLSIGAACTLTEIKETKLFPLLDLACGRVADHTNQCRITLGGNLCGTIIYRETALPLLLCDARVTLRGPEGERTANINDVFCRRMRLLPGELVARVSVPAWALTARHVHVKKTAHEKIDYPLVNATVLWKGDILRAAFSGVCAYPFRSARIEAILNERGVPAPERARRAVVALPEHPHGDAEGSGEYRAFVMEHMLCDLLEGWEHGSL
ncbi:MAG TPA: FAD binding domain-containing protein [Clostridia bacterium]|nr:FAD binding domain-containing protein [Clostridia bacterium]